MTAPQIIGYILGPAIFVIIGILLSFLISELYNAPEGWEDKNGFHFGKKPLEKSLGKTEVQDKPDKAK